MTHYTGDVIHVSYCWKKIWKLCVRIIIAHLYSTAMMTYYCSRWVLDANCVKCRHDLFVLQGRLEDPTPWKTRRPNPDFVLKQANIRQTTQVEYLNICPLLDIVLADCPNYGGSICVILFYFGVLCCFFFFVFFFFFHFKKQLFKFSNRIKNNVSTLDSNVWLCGAHSKFLAL